MFKTRTTTNKQKHTHTRGLVKRDSVEASGTSLALAPRGRDSSAHLLDDAAEGLVLANSPRQRPLPRRAAAVQSDWVHGFVFVFVCRVLYELGVYVRDTPEPCGWRRLVRCLAPTQRRRRRQWASCRRPEWHLRKSTRAKLHSPIVTPPTGKKKKRKGQALACSDSPRWNGKNGVCLHVLKLGELDVEACQELWGERDV